MTGHHPFAFMPQPTPSAVVDLNAIVMSSSIAEQSSATQIAMADVLAALSRALDLTEGQPMGHSVRSCVIGMRIGSAIGLSEGELSALYYALLLKDAGCSSNAARMAALFGSDDQSVKPSMKVVDWDNRLQVAVETWRATGLNESLWSKVQHFVTIARQENMTKEIIAARCERGADIARRLGFPEATVQAIHSLDEHWNGNGYPDGLRAEAIPMLSRILNIAQAVEVFVARDGVDGAFEMLKSRRGRWFEPRLVDEVLQWKNDRLFWTGVHAPEVHDEVLSLEPARQARVVDEHGLDQVAQAFADIIDAKTPYTYRHSSNVAMYAQAIARELGFDEAQLRQTKRAGLLHDIGKVGISNRILDKAGPLDSAERAAMERHPEYTWEILGKVSAFSSFAWQAATHHEKLDGSGYPFRLRGDALDSASRLMVVADIYDALTADRPYRAGMSHEKAISILHSERDTKIDGACLDALESALSARGESAEL